MPSFTHFRPAQPVLVAHFFLSHAAPLRRDFGAAGRARDRSRRAAARLRRDCRHQLRRRRRHALARDLGFCRVVDNSMDASSDRDFAATFLYACAMTMVHLSRLAEDLIIFCGDEHRFFELSDALSTGSSMMPQKKNPDPLELVRGQDRPRDRTSRRRCCTTIKGCRPGYNKDLQEDKEAVFGAEDTLAGCLAVVAARSSAA